MEAALPSQHEHHQVSFHFWNCQLTEASPKYSWDPEGWCSGVGAAASDDGAGERRQRRAARNGDGAGDVKVDGDGKTKEKSSDVKVDGDGKTKEKSSDVKVNANGGENGHKNGDSSGKGEGNGEEQGEESGEAAIDADYMQHVLKVNACILGSKASGIHLITVRTKCYQSEADSCPIVCIDPASQRTLSLGYEFVLDSQNEVTFELAEGTGPVWLTGLHQVRVHDDSAVSAEASGDDDFCVIDDTSRFRLANGNAGESGEDDGDEEEEEMEEGDEEEDEEGDGDGDEEEEKVPKTKLGKRSPITTEQLRGRKRRRVGDGEDGDGAAVGKEPAA